MTHKTTSNQVSETDILFTFKPLDVKLQRCWKNILVYDNSIYTEFLNDQFRLPLTAIENREESNKNYAYVQKHFYMHVRT